MIDMKRTNVLHRRTLAVLFLAPALPLLADDAPGIKLEAPSGASKNRFGVSYRAGFNVTAKFKNVGDLSRGPSGRGPGPATGSNLDRDYDDGYNRRDVSGNEGGDTWNWAYRNPGQVDEDSVTFRSTTASPITSKTYDSDPQHGFELTYQRELGMVGQSKAIWGIEGGLGWTDIEIRDHRRLFGGTTVIQDEYSHTGIDTSHNIIPPGADTPPPFNDGESTLNPGTVGGPGPLISSSPSRTVTRSATGTSIAGAREFDADLYSFRIGPYVEIPIDERWSISFSAGFATGVIDGEYHLHNQRVTTAAGTVRQNASGSETDVLFGGYASAMIHCAINEEWGVFAGGQYLGLFDRYQAEAGGQRIELDLKRTAFFTVGVTFSF